MHGNRGMEPDLFSMDAKEIRGFLAVLTPQVHPEEMEETGRRNLWPDRSADARGREQSAGKMAKEETEKVGSSGGQRAVGGQRHRASGRAADVGNGGTLDRGTLRHAVVRLAGATMVMGGRAARSSPKRWRSGARKCATSLVEMASVPDLPTWKPEGFVFEMVDQVQTSNGVLLSAAYRNDAGDVLTLTVQELPVEGGYTIEYERDALSGKVKENEGIAYYCMENMGQYMVIWQQNRVALNIAGDINEEEAFHMVDSI